MRRVLRIVGLAALLLALTVTPVLAAGGAQQTGGELDKVGEVLGVLGVFASVMLILALGAEVVIDMFKMFIGLKSKPTSLESLKKLDNWLPGTLKDLGVATSAQEQVKGYISALNGMVKDVEESSQMVTEIETWLPDKLKDLALEGAEHLWEKEGPALLERLQKTYNLDASILAQVESGIRMALSGLEGTTTAEMEEHLTALTNLLQGVENRRYQIQSPLRKVLRKLRDVPVLGLLVSGPESLLNWIRGNKGDPRVPDQVPVLTPDSVGQYLLERDNLHKDEEKSRLRWLRILSLAVGIVLAVKLNIDAVRLIEPLIGEAYAAQLTQPLFAIPGNQFFENWFLIGPTWLALKGVINALTAGMLLSGLGASAGSAFWHDQLGKLQSAKKAQTELQTLVDSVKAVAEGG